MLKNITLIFILILTSSSSYIIDTNFKESSGIDALAKYNVRYKNDTKATEKISFLERLYNQNSPSKVAYSPDPKIPKIIHQIWLSGEALPENYLYYQSTWKKFHPDWEFKLWTLEEIAKFNLKEADIFYNKARTHAGRSDIFKYELLNRIGGVYVDMDIECFAPIDELIHKYSFFGALEPPLFSKHAVTIGNNIIGSAPKHKVLEATIKLIHKKWENIEKEFDENNSNNLRSKALRSNFAFTQSTTLYPLTEAFLKSVTLEDKDIIVLPSGYCHPFYLTNVNPTLNFFSRVFLGKGKLGSKIIKRPETVCLHYYGDDISLVEKVPFFDSLFEHSNFKSTLYNYITGRFTSLTGSKKYRFVLEEMFNKNFPTNVAYKVEQLIPKTVHVLWLHNGKFTPRFNERLDNWRKNNLGWEIKVWNKKDLNALITEIHHTFSGLTNYNLERELIKLFILERYGGTVIEEKMDSLKTLDELSKKYTFVAGTEHMASIYKDIHISTNIIMVTKDHIIIRKTMNDILKDWNNNSNDIKHQQNRFATLINDKLTYNFYKFFQLDGKAIVFPTTYFNSTKQYKESFTKIRE